jgi:photosystem II stability/assembly factor-like uncharacterized protein
MKKPALSFFLCLAVLLAAFQPHNATAQPAVAPSLSSITPNNFASGINTPVTITGANLDSVGSVKLGAVALTNIVKADNGLQITAQVPYSIAPGIYDLTVTDSSAQSATLTSAVTVAAAAAGWASNGPYGGDLWEPMIDPQNSNRIFVSAWNSGLFLTTSAGSSWSYNLPNQVGKVHFYYPTPSQPPVLYLDGSGLLRSTDNGQTWQQTGPAGCQWGCGSEVARYPYPTQQDWVFLTAHQFSADATTGLYKSTDRGDSWAQIAGTSGWNLEAVALDPDDINHILVGTDDGKIYTSTNAGTTWSAAQQVGTYIGSLVFSPNLYNGKRSIWADQNDHYTYQGDQIYRSDDGGATWNQVLVQADYTIMSLSYHPSVAGLAWAGGKGGAGGNYHGDGFVTEDDGATWNPLNANIGEINDILVVPGSSSRQMTTLYATTSSGMYKSSNGGATWTETDTGLGAVVPSTIVASPFNADEAFAATESKGLLHTVDGGTHWGLSAIPAQSGSTSIAADFQTPGRIYVSAIPDWALYVTNDYGATYTKTDIDLQTPDWHFVSAIAAHPQASGHVLAAACIVSDFPTLAGWAGSVYASEDGGLSFTRQTTPSNTNCINSFTYDPSHLQTVYAGTRDGYLVSTDGGANWSVPAHQPNVQSIGPIAVDPRDSQTIYLYGSDLDMVGLSGRDQALFATYDGGATWTRLDGLHSGFVFNLQIVPIGAQYWIYANTWTGLRFLRDLPDGPFDPYTSWEKSSGVAGIAAVPSFAAAVEPSRVVFYIGTSGGALSNTASRLVAASSEQNLPGGVYRRQGTESAPTLPQVPGWHLSNKAGFGNTSNLITALEVFDGQFYAATSNWDNGMRIWRSANGSDWAAVTDMGMGGANSSSNAAVPDMIVFNGSLYASVGWGSNEGQIWRTTTGSSWSKVAGSEFAGPNRTVTAMAVFKNMLYAMVGETEAEIWRSPSGNSGSWVRVDQGGFSGGSNTLPTGAVVFNGRLYITVMNNVAGVTVWSSADGTTWRQDNTSGFGDVTNNAGGVAVLGGYLYVGTLNKVTGGQLWRYDGSIWSRVVADGFGDIHNYNVIGLYTIQNRLMATTENAAEGVQVWTSVNGVNWTALNLNGFGNKENLCVHWSSAGTIFAGTMYLGTWNGATGGEIWQYVGFPAYLPTVKR